MQFPPHPTLSDAQAYAALSARDARFDGRLFVGVTSTGIYCRPVCRVRLPQARNCRFFEHAAAAEQAGFRPCLRCRPEQAPGLAMTDAAHTLAEAAARAVQALVDRGERLILPALAAELGITERHLRRIFTARFGVSPHDWWTTQRLLLAKRLLADTQLPITEVAAASGFDSLRRFHASFSTRYRLSPRAVRQGQGPAKEWGLWLPWRPPYAHQPMWSFLGARPLPGVEHLASDGVWRRTLALQWQGQLHRGWLALRLDPTQGGVWLQVAPALAPALAQVLARVRHLLDLDAPPESLAPDWPDFPQTLTPGLRVPGCIDGFETTVRIILGQQVSVAAACTLAGRLTQALGEPLATPWPELSHLFPSPAALAQANVDQLGQLGIIRARSQALQAVARAVLDGHLHLAADAPMQATLDALKSLPGIGDWTTELVALRVLAWPDAFPASDAGVLRALGGTTARQAQARAQAWRPWRAYAVMQLWQGLNPSKETS